MFKFKSILVIALAVCASSAWAQLMPKAELTGGYTYTSLDEGVGSRLGSNGWNTGGTFFMNNWLGLEGNIAGASNTQSASFTTGTTTVSASASDKHYTYVFGPRLQFGHGRTNPFVHGLFGIDHESISASALGFSTSVSDNAFASALGGGVELGLSKHLGVITGGDYLMTHHASATQNNLRISAGLSFRFGSGWGGSKF
ncbi:MAG TPA: outer membrane beta-barrel protein [Terriglobales bacterium]|jgi:peptidoglycan-associated lipoprotein|nr:outer membrane beta-barrel protein [Terriglobales bacterium]